MVHAWPSYLFSLEFDFNYSQKDILSKIIVSCIGSAITEN